MVTASRNGGAALFLLPLCLLIAACASTSSMKDVDAIPAGKGVMVLKAVSDQQVQLQWVDYSDTVTFGSSMSEYYLGPKGSVLTPAGERIWVLTVDAGEYMWGDVLLVSQYPAMRASFHTGTRFTIEEGKINYVGDIHLEMDSGRVGMSVTSSAADVAAYLEASYPLLMNRYELEKSLTEQR